MKKQNFLVTLLLCIAASIGTVTAQTIHGKVVNTDGQPVDGATVVLQTPDSVFVDATITDKEGSFLLNHTLSQYRLIIQHILYQTLQKEGRGEEAGVFALQPKDYALGEVVVKGERPVVKVEGSRLSYDMPQLIKNKLVSSAYDCIKELPGVLEQNETLTLAGTSTPVLILNGKPSTMTQDQIITLLKGMPASRVEKAEVMYSAPPQLHVRGAAINIVLKGYKAEEGSNIQGEVHGAYLQKEKASGEGGLALAYTSQKIDADVMYNFAANRHERQDLDLITKHTVQGKVYNMEQYMTGAGDKPSHTLRTGITYKPNDKNQLGLAYTSQLSPNDKQNTYTKGNLSDAHSTSRDESQMHNIALDYTASFGLRTGVNYTYFTSDGVQDFQEISREGNDIRFINRTNQRIERWNVYADQSHSLSKGWTLNYGTALNYVSNRNRQLYESGQDMSDRNTESGIDEYTYNLYAGFDKSFNPQWSLSASAAVEYYQMEEYKKWAVYPTLQLSYVYSPQHIFQLTFSSDKTYPDYWTLSGATGYMSSYTESQGNMYLRPYTAYSTQLSYILKSKYIFQVGYDYMPDFFQQMLYLDSSQLKAIYNFRNWDYSSKFKIVSVLPFKAGNWLNSQLTLVGMHMHAKASDYFDAPFDHKKWIGIVSLSNTFTLSQKPNIKLEISAFAQSEGLQGNYDISPLWMMDSALRWSFAGDKAMLQLKGTDIFNGLNPKTTIRSGTQHIDMEVRSYARSLTLSFSYKFNGYKKKEVKDVDTSRFGHS